MEENMYCSHCECLITSDDCYEIHGDIICEDCRDDFTVTCDYCHDLIWDSEDCGDENICLCSHCYERHYTHCDNCDRLIENGYAYEHEGDYYCSECYRDISENSPIHEYGYKPEPKFFGKYAKESGTRFLGVELEIDGAGRDEDNAQEILDIANESETHIYIKSDGSLDEGMEIVTHPMTLDYHLNHFCWGAVLRKAINLDYRSHQTTTCGLHIHVNRGSLGETKGEQEDTISRILYFVEHHWNEMLKFSRRSEYAMDRWAARYGYENSPKKLLDKAKNSYGRYCAVNLCPHATIEFRLFRGTLKLNTLLATLQMVEHICHVAYTLTDEELQSLSWSEFVANISEPELIQYLKERRLYINNEITYEEEV